MKNIILIIFSIFYALLLSGQKNSDVILVETDNAAMEKAFAKARNTLDEFLETVSFNASDNEIYGAYLKVIEEEVVEYLWVSGVEKYNEEYFIGVLITKPELTSIYEEGATIGFRKSDIYDWQIYDKKKDKLKGAFTFKVLEKRDRSLYVFL